MLKNNEPCRLAQPALSLGILQPLKNQPTYIPGLDVLRGIAILMVLLWHVVFYPLGQQVPHAGMAWLNWLGSWLWACVDLFFVLSGFLIGRILLSHQHIPGFWKRFYIRRFIRIVPPYALLLLGFVVAMYAGVPSVFPWLTVSAFPTYSYLCFIQNYWVTDHFFGANWLAPTWSLAVEEQFYLLMPWLIFWIPKKWLPRVLIAGMLAALLFRFLLYPGIEAYTWLPARMDGLLMGVLLAWLWLNNGFQYSRQLSKRMLWLLLLLLGICLLYTSLWKAELGAPLLHSLLLLLFASAVCWVLLQPVQPIGNRLLRWLAALGQISYGVYLWHQPVNGLVHLLLGHAEPQLHSGTDLLAAIAIMGITCLWAYLLYRWMERPLLQWGAKRFGYEG